METPAAPWASCASSFQRHVLLQVAIKWPKEEPAVVRLGTFSGANNGALLERSVRYPRHQGSATLFHLARHEVAWREYPPMEPQESFANVATTDSLQTPHGVEFTLFAFGFEQIVAGKPTDCHSSTRSLRASRPSTSTTSQIGARALDPRGPKELSTVTERLGLLPAPLLGDAFEVRPGQGCGDAKDGSAETLI
jgi:hypothetical protein